MLTWGNRRRGPALLFGVVTLLLALAAPASAGEDRRGRGDAPSSADADESTDGSGDALFFRGAVVFGDAPLNIRLSARSGPDGSRPRGAIFGVTLGIPLLAGVVTCLRVEGNRASAAVVSDLGPFLLVGEDNGGNGQDRFLFRRIGRVRNCPSPADFALTDAADRVRITDAP